MRAEWKHAPDFAEIAEALRVTTTQIMAATERDGQWLVLFTEDADDETLSVVILRRGVDDVLFAATTPTRRPGLWESIKRHALQDVVEQDPHSGRWYVIDEYGVRQHGPYIDEREARAAAARH